jgi:hypothetical protein
MDTAWIQVFVLTLSECIAPAGKTVCQERDFELQFLTRNDCEAALEQLIKLKEASNTVIVDRAASVCAPSARERETYATLEEITAAMGDMPGWRSPDPAVARKDDAKAAHEARLAELKTCEEAGGIAPCKIGEIIVEAATGDPVEVWRSEDQ